MKQNNQYALYQWIKLILPVIILVFMITALTITKQFIPLGFGLFTLAVLILLQYLGRKSAVGKFGKLFKSETPEGLLNYYDTAYRRAKVQDKDEILIYSKAMILSYYGRFDEAMDLMGRVNWDEKIPYFKSLELSIKALIEYLKTGDYKEGLRLFHEAQKHGEISDNFPRTKQYKEIFRSNIEIGELLSGNIDDSIIASLEAKYSSSSANLYNKLLIGWCLAKIYKQTGNMEASNAKLNYVKGFAPYCSPLTNF